jgi:hypothetical protein
MNNGGSGTLDELRARLEALEGKVDTLVANLRQNSAQMADLMDKLPGWFQDAFIKNPDLEYDLRNLKEMMCRRDPPGC